MLGSRVRSRRKELKLNQDELADLVGVVRQTISSWENDAFAPEGKNIELLAASLKTSVAYLMGETDNPASPSEKPNGVSIGREVLPSIGEEPVWIPIVDPHVCAGAGNGYPEINWDPVGRYPLAPADLMGISWYSGTLRIIRVDGNSMEPRYRNGDMILFSEESVVSGDVIVALWDGRLFLRGYVEDKKNGTFRLKALNSDYADIVIDPGDERFQPLGKVLGKVNRIEPDKGFW